MTESRRDPHLPHGHEDHLPLIRISAILNTHSGTLKACDLDALERRLTATLDTSRFTVVSVSRTDRPIHDVLAAAVAEDSDCLLVGGGDGSVAAAAAAAWRSGKILAVLPGGTMNLYARTLGMPLDVHESIDALTGAEVGTMDLATADGVPFIHQFTVGLHADAVGLRRRSHYASRFGKLLATARAFVAVIADPPRFPVEIRGDALETRTLELSALSVTNNLLGEGHVPYADDPDGGRLGLYHADPLSPWSAARLMVDVMLGEYASNEDIGVRSAERIELSFPGSRHRGRALLDGEIVEIGRTVELRLHAGAARVLRPSEVVA